MIQTDSSKGASLKEIREREKKQKDDELKARCEALAIERYGEQKIKELSNANKGLWYLPVTDDDGNIEALALMRPITRQDLSYASTKITDDGLYAFLEAAMIQCFVEGDKCILDDDEYFIPAANSFNKILEGKKASLLKR